MASGVDPLTRARQANERLVDLLKRAEICRRERDEALCELRESGLSLGAIAAQTGLSKSLVAGATHQIRPGR